MFEHATGRRAGVVDQDIDPTERGMRGLDKVSRIGGFGEILRPVSLAISAAVRSSGSLRRAQIATSTPSRASARVIALPIPSLAPVTMAFLSLIARSMTGLLPMIRHEFKHSFLRHDSRGRETARRGDLRCGSHFTPSPRQGE
jgi:hypothetical protein